MIAEIGGKFINPEHVSFVEAKPDKRCLVHLDSGKYLEVWQAAEDVVRAINEALTPRLIKGVEPSKSDGEVWGAGPMLAFPTRPTRDDIDNAIVDAAPMLWPSTRRAIIDAIDGLING